MMVDVVRQWAPPQSAEEAQRFVAPLAPRSSVRAWYLAYWEPGDPWQPVERWAIAQMIPRLHYDRAYELDERADLIGTGMESFETQTVMELDGPNPRHNARYDAILGRLVYENNALPPLYSLRQWQLWHEHDALANTVWWVQGEHGGHKPRLSHIEKAMAGMAGLPLDTPVPGELPYAPVDQRVTDALQRAMALAAACAHVREDWYLRSAEAEDEQHDANDEERKLLAAYSDWVAAQVDRSITTAHFTIPK
jgi:hypothetical protein